LLHGDIRTIGLSRRFDDVIAMFAAMGYQATKEDLGVALLNAAKHLNEHGLLILEARSGFALIA
jgi:hypothetical protein